MLIRDKKELALYRKTAIVEGENEIKFAFSACITNERR
jgi:hypothetical protein